MSTTHKKICSGHEAVRKIKNGSTVATGGFCGAGFPEHIAVRLKEHFLETGEPKNLTLVYAAGQGDFVSKGLNHLGCEGLVKRVIGGHWGAVPFLQKLAIDNKIEAYNLPQGVISHMYRDIAAHKPRTITKVGVRTFVDPENGGGKINERTTEDLVEQIYFDNTRYLAYKTFPVDVAVLRGTTADPSGNVTVEKEALTLENLAMATAARNSGGIVIVQVERIAANGSLNPRQVKIPGILVDHVVVSNPELHWQTYAEQFNPALCSMVKVPLDSIPPLELNLRKIMARRAFLELNPGNVINLGIGVPESVAVVANEENMINQIVLTAEPGVIGGVPSGGLSFGTATNSHAVIDQPSQFDFYDGGGLDIAILGLAQADAKGNLNVSKFGPRIAGAGGFINISQNAKSVVFVGSFTASGLEVEIKNKKLSILKEGRIKKFVRNVEQITFSGPHAFQTGQPVLFVTERCVFKLTEQGMTLVEVAPGIDIGKDILRHMDFRPLIADDIKAMDDRIFREGPMNTIGFLSETHQDRNTSYSNAVL